MTRGRSESFCTVQSTLKCVRETIGTRPSRYNADEPWIAVTSEKG